MKINYVLRMLSLVLVIAILINVLPAQALGEEFRSLSLNTTNERTQDETDYAVTVVSEISEERTQFSKEFKMSNGMHMAVIYPEAVHFEQNGKWAEIDNTLVAEGDTSTGVYRNKAGNWNVSFPRNMDHNFVTVSQAGYSLSFRMDGEIHQMQTSQIMNGSVSVFATSHMSVSDPQLAVNTAQKSEAKVQSMDTAAMKASMEHPETFVDKLFSRLRYDEVYNNTDIEYDVDSTQVKESIILESYNTSLRGYRYYIEATGMTPELQADGSILFYTHEQDETVMMMPAPFLIDAAGERSEDVGVTLTPSGSGWLLIYTLPNTWLASAGRQWPVILDPVVKPSGKCQNMQDQTVASVRSLSYKAGVVQVGFRPNYGIMRFYMMYNDIPEMTSADVIVQAYMRLYRPSTGTTDTIVEVRKVDSTWTSSGITWNNKPGYSDIVEDYVVCKAKGHYRWDVTDIVRSWYTTGENTGMMFKATDAIEQAGGDCWKQFYSSDYSDFGSSMWPTLNIYFRNSNGLEDYWDYTSHSAGRAGTGYINDYSGNLTWVRGDLGFGGNRMPVSISHIYNANDVAGKNGEVLNEYGLGLGWRTNFNQTIKAVGSYYAWTDSDGTIHYFENRSGTYIDEDGLELTLTVGNGFVITDKYGNSSIFDTNGRLVQMQNNQETPSTIQVGYTTDTGLLISQVIDGVGRKYNFTYTDGLLSKISYSGTGETDITYVSYEYANSMLIQIADLDGGTSKFTYTGNGLLSSAQDLDGYKLSYTYTAGTPPRVATVQEAQVLGSTEIAGGSLSVSYSDNQTQFTDHNNNVVIKQFNDWGNTLSIQDSEGRAQYAQFALNDREDEAKDNTQKGNQMLLSSKMQNTVSNVMDHSSFETGNTWISMGSGTTVSVSEDVSYIGSKALSVVTTSTSGIRGAQYTGYLINDGETYTFSAWVKGSGSYLSLATVNGTVATGEATDTAEWTRLQVSYTHSGAAIKIYARLVITGTQTVYMDCVQMEENPTASRYNLVENGDFRLETSHWTASDTIESTDGYIEDTVAVSPLSSGQYSITGNPLKEKTLTQTVYVSGSAGDTLVLSGWAYGNSVPITETRAFGLKAIFNFTDGTTSEPITVSFNHNLDGNWQYSAAPIIPEKNYSSVTIQICYIRNANSARFDGIQLFKEEFGSSYTYDANGNVVSVVDLQDQETTYNFDTNNNLTSIIQNDKAKMTYTYDNHHNVKTATTAEGVVYEFEYDDFGNNTRVTIKNGNSTITTTATYSTDGNRLVSTTDALEKTTTYCYNENTNVLEWVQCPEDSEDTRTRYTYDNMYRLARAEVTTDTNLYMSAHYTYTEDRLTAITAGNTTYSFIYNDSFGALNQIKAGSTILASYTYDDTLNRYLTRLSYGNMDSISYTYDHLGRVTLETYEDGSTVSYKYDNTGALATVTDSETGRTTTYYYDFTDRLMKYVEKGTGFSHSVGYEFDSLNNLTQLVEDINGTKLTTSYTYDDDNRVSSVSNGTVSQHYTYDAYGRLSQRVTKNGDAVIKTETYTYNNPTDTTSSGQVASITVTHGSNTTTFQYEYDDNGNITYSSGGLAASTYVYDSVNQLVRENNPVAGSTWTWTYDANGNIVNRSRYSYTPVEPGQATESITSTYGHYGWGDLLTSRNEVGITWDVLGNTLTDGTWTYTWKHGRQLESMSDGTTTWTYTYDANGLRTKRTNGTTTYEYVYNGGQLIQMLISATSVDAEGNAVTTLTDTLIFDHNVGTVTHNGTTYYYLYNLMGDVTAILDASGTKVVEYGYEAYGRIMIVYGSMKDTLGQINPIRYRGYVYDRETQLYYLQSRYYNPEWGRFINADALISTGQGLLGNNMFAYCNNNPANCADEHGLMCQFIHASLRDGSRPIASFSYEMYKKFEAQCAASNITLYSTTWSALMDWRETYLPLSVEHEYAAYLYSVDTTMGTRYYFSKTYRGSKAGKIMSANVIIPTLILEAEKLGTGNNLVAQVHTHPAEEMGFHNDFPSYSPNIYGGDRIANNLFHYPEMYIIPYTRCPQTPMVIAYSDRSTWCNKVS